SGLISFLSNDDSATQPKPPRTLTEHASFQLHALVGDHRTNVIEPALFAALLLLPFLWRTRARNTMLFCIVAAGAGWLVMLLSGGGLFVHHTVLLWPLPQMLMAVAFAEASQRRAFGRRALV